MPSDILTANEAAEYLKVSVETVKAKARAGTIPAAKIGREWRFSQRQLLHWLEDASWPPEELVEQALVALAEERMAAATDEDLIPLDEVEAEFAR